MSHSGTGHLILAVMVFVAVSAVAGTDDDEWQRKTAKRQREYALAFEQMMSGVDSLELLTLDNESGGDKAEVTAKDVSKRLDRWKIIQQVAITDRREVAQLVAGLKESIATGGPIAACFEPRHALRFKKGNCEIQVIVCFECAGMDVKGWPAFEGAPISGVAAKDFYLVMRAHGLTKPDRLDGMTDDVVAKRLVGSWVSHFRSDGRNSLRIEGVGTEVFQADGTYLNEAEYFTVGENGVREHYDKTTSSGRWRVEKGMLVLSEMKTGNEMPGEGDFDAWEPIIEVSDARYVIGSSASLSGEEYTHERK
jgi:hypothetical protein